MGPNTATIGAPAPKIMQDVVPPYAKALHGGSVIAADVADPMPTPTPMPLSPTPPSPMPMPEPPAPQTPPTPEAPPMPQPAPPAPTPEPPPVATADVPVAQEQVAPAQPMFPQVQAVEDNQAAPAPLSFTPQPQADGHVAAHHHAKVNTPWLVIGIAGVVAIALAAVAVMAMRG